ncbi:MAG: hypothetical protein ACTHK6_08340 [Solirubrobacterales bacterium]
MPKYKFFFGNEELETAELDGVQVVRDSDGVWRYAESWIEIPGARDVTLTERFQPKFVVFADKEIERVVVDGNHVRDFPELLGWCLEIGTPIHEGDELVEVLVPYRRWEEHDRVPNELISPEHHGKEAERELAEAERQYREEEIRFERAADARAEVLRKWAGVMTRQEAKGITGLSVGRIQQLVREEPLEDVDQPVLELFEDGPVENLKELKKIAAENGMKHDLSFLSSVVRDLKARGLLEGIKGGALALTAQGERLLLRTQVLEPAPGAK